MDAFETVTFQLMRAMLFCGVVASVYAWAAGWVLLRWRGGAPTGRLDRAFRSRWIGALLLGAAFAGLVCIAYGLFIEPQRVGVTMRTIETPKLAAGERVRIIQLTDLHIRHGGLREWRVIELVRGLVPVLILHAGDFWGARGSENPTAELLRSWSVPQYTCMGNADRLPALSEVMRNGGVTILNGTSATETVRGTRLTIAGFPPEDRPRMKNALKQLPADTFNILLCHYPCGFLETWGTPVDLMLAGHTHGGQIRLPWYGALITLDPTGKRYESGFFHERGVYLSVSRGIGCEPGIPEARFLCPPEIVCIDLVGKP